MDTDAFADDAPNISYVTLGVRDEIFAVNVHYVREILEYRPPVPLHQAPVCFVGVVDVRGTTVPVIDLAVKLGLPPEPITLNTRILVLEIPVNDQVLTIGLLVSKVFEVADFEVDHLETTPEVGVRWNSAYIEAIGRLRGGFVIVFNMQKLLSSQETALLPTQVSELT